MNQQDTNWYHGMTLEEMEQIIIMRSLQIHMGNKTKTAESLGISIRTIDNKLEKYEELKRAGEKRTQDREIKAREHLLQAQGRTDVEPTAEVTAQHSVPLRQRQEVQKMPPQQFANDSAHKAGKSK